MSDPKPLKLSEVRAVFRLVGEVRELGADPGQWRPHMIRRLRKIAGAEVVISSEVHFRTTKDPDILSVVDIGWGCDEEDKVWQIHTEREETPDVYWLTAGVAPPRDPSLPREGALVPIKPRQPIYGGTSFILSQYVLPHAGAVDQLGLHRAHGDQPFTPSQHRLMRLFHVELGRLWKADAIRGAKDPTQDLPPRLGQTLDELLAGSSEKQIAAKLELSRHTIHNYVKALHQRFDVNSRGELLARAGTTRADFTPKLSLKLPRRNRSGKPGSPSDVV